MKRSSVGFKSSYWLCLLETFHHLLTYKCSNMSKQEKPDIWWVMTYWSGQLDIFWKCLFPRSFAKQKQTKSIPVQRNEAILFSEKLRCFVFRATKKSISVVSWVNWTNRLIRSGFKLLTHHETPSQKGIFRHLFGSELNLLLL